ncbi:hypothetical protein [Mycobacteroides abscessus]|uniref:hypothetical protein n=1 Tax=Mycobacteroides abscessus TaxID=36809 RepID=UPI00092806D9|nr:hypothetical protein [Mycobacteroides abscessus]QSN49588.1 hypothetical protein I3U33_12880 [Mycobacteroides abscessus subsp. abscessus]SIC89925.1 Uncharacterised protein [Mycobacteroides abscessus subsp. abscessus]SID80488.1 Uncharacterised protein [Mycobacteroides abscessus subsp. abscessus]SIE28557.1 Uncharacterised protein [Mycobacteroides abscessus subsp. abscessus]SIJ64484.1 Uncharacterised protein [Mycobacteroides abscessus subsp. abscessus]
MKLEPTEAQRKAIIGFLSRPYPHYDPYKPDYEGWLDAFLAAANSIPEGPPVDTIARRPDGAWIAFVEPAQPGVWRYRQLLAAGQGFPEGRDADSWPVIFTPGEAVGSGPTTDGGETYDPREPSREELREYFHQDLAEHCQADDPDEYPDEYHEGDKPRLERLMREPSVFDADPHGTVNLDGTLPTFTPDPTAQQEPEEGPPCETRGWLRQEFDKAEKRSAQVPDRAKPKVVRGTVEDALRPDDVELLETDPMEFVRRTQQEPAERRAYLGPYEEPEEFTDGYTVDALFKERAKYWNRNDPATTHPVSPESTNCVPKPRTPRVVDRLGVDEQGSRWRGRGGTEYWFNGHGWCDSAGSDGKYEYPQGYEPNMASPYTEVLPDVG